MLINSIKLINLLSFGDTADAVQLRPFNVIIGANGSGKSNLLEAIDLLRNAPNELAKPIREGGGVSEWFWKGAKEKNPNASLDVNIKCLNYSLYYGLVFGVAFDQRFFIIDEKIEMDNSNSGSKFFYRSEIGL